MPQRSAAPALVRSAACLQAPGIPRMDSITLARAQMGLSLAFHILFSALGVGLPLLPLTGTGAFAQYPHLALAAPPSAPPASPVQLVDPTFGVPPQGTGRLQRALICL